MRRMRRRKTQWRRGVQEAVAAHHQQNGKDEDEEDGEDEEEDAKEDLGVEVDVLLAASGRCPRLSAGTLQRGIPVPRCCL